MSGLARDGVLVLSPWLSYKATMQLLVPVLLALRFDKPATVNVKCFLFWARLEVRCSSLQLSVHVAGLIGELLP